MAGRVQPSSRSAFTIKTQNSNRPQHQKATAPPLRGATMATPHQNKSVFAQNKSVFANKSQASNARRVDPPPKRRGFTTTADRNFFTRGVNFFQSARQKFMALHWNRVRIPLGILIITLFLLQAISTGSTSWLTLSDIHRQGIFQVCYQSSGGIECSAYEKLPGYLVAVQALMMVAVFVYIGAFVYYFFMLYTGKLLSSVLTGILALNVVLVMSSLVLYTDENRGVVAKTQMTWGWGYAIAWVDVFVTIITAVVAMLDERYSAACNES